MCQVSFILDPDDMRNFTFSWGLMGGRKITHSNHSDDKQRWDSDSWVLAKMDSYSERKEVGM